MRLLCSALTCLLLCAACAPTQRSEVRTVLSTQRKQLNDCHTDHFARAAAVRDGVLIEVAQRDACRRATLEEREVLTEVREHPDYVMWGTEFGVFMIWLGLWAAADDLGSGLVAAMFAPFGIGGITGFVVDIGDFKKETTQERESEAKNIRVERTPLKRSANLPVELELRDGRKLRSTTNENGRVFIELPSDVAAPGTKLSMTLRAGTFSQAIDVVVPTTPVVTP